MDLTEEQQLNMKKVLTILYLKIDKLRQERNDLRVSLYQN